MNFRFLRSPLCWILGLAMLLRLAGLFWGLPASDGWDDDGFAPRNFLTALALTYKSGSFFTYPPLHAFVLAILTLPGVIIALLHAHSFSQADVVGEITKPGYMTFFAVVARLVSLAMSLGIVWAVGRMAALVGGARAGLFASAACALGVLLTYYGQVSNLDVPYLFWSVLALLFCMRAIAGRDPAQLRWAALLAAAAIATKDQAYAIFALSVPAILLAWFAADDWPRRHVRRMALILGVSAVASLFALLLIDGAITNPGGFARRIAFLAGPASQDYAIYQHNLAGRLALLGDAWRYFTQGTGAASLLLAVLGIALQARRRHDRPAWIAGWLPLLAIISFTLCFNFVALRTDARFLLPQAVLAAVYIGIAADWLATTARPWLGSTALGLVALSALYDSTAVAAAMLHDPRYQAESWMAAHVRPGDTIETYGQNAFLPRFPAQTAVTRILETPLKIRNPLPHVTESRAPFAAIAERKPRFIVVSAWWVDHYRIAPQTLPPGHAYSRNQQRQFAEADARRYFTGLHDGQLGYRLVYVAAPVSVFWPSIHIHESLNETIRIFERMP
jgi:4-amino-4-deoxy-L-arabinose transferase-like glycosyltransferase